MYRIALEGDDTVIRIKRDLMNQGTVAKLLDLINLAAVLENSKFAGAQREDHGPDAGLSHRGVIAARSGRQ